MAREASIQPNPSHYALKPNDCEMLILHKCIYFANLGLIAFLTYASQVMSG